jgi:hypothetical protein
MKLSSVRFVTVFDILMISTQMNVTTRMSLTAKLSHQRISISGVKPVGLRSFVLSSGLIVPFLNTTSATSAQAEDTLGVSTSI